MRRMSASFQTRRLLTQSSFGWTTALITASLGSSSGSIFDPAAGHLSWTDGKCSAVKPPPSQFGHGSGSLARSGPGNATSWARFAGHFGLFKNGLLLGSQKMPFGPHALHAECLPLATATTAATSSAGSETMPFAPHATTGTTNASSASEKLWAAHAVSEPGPPLPTGGKKLFLPAAAITILGARSFGDVTGLHHPSSDKEQRVDRLRHRIPWFSHSKVS